METKRERKWFGVHLPVTYIVITILHVALILSLVDPVDDVLMAVT